MKAQNNSRQEEMFAHVMNWEKEQGQVSKKEFCRRHGFTVDAFYYWVQKYQRHSQPLKGFVPVQVPGGHPNPAPTPMTIEYPNKVRLELPEGAPTSVIMSLIKNY